jgi:uncharacterized protein YdaU (DUF1376 family)
MAHDNGNGKLPAEWFLGDRWTTSRGFTLPLEARGLYREMLTQAWLRNGFLPKSLKKVCLIVGATEAEWRRAWPIVKPFWRVEGAYLVNDTQREIYAEAKRRADAAKSRALSGARGRWGDA